MKFYNPFKWQIVEFADGKFGVRKLSVLDTSYGYLDVYGGEWYYAKLYIEQNCRYDLETAHKVLSQTNKMQIKRVVQ